MNSNSVKNYVLALEANDLVLASKVWRAAQDSGHEEEKQAMIMEMDFSLVETYSLAQLASDFNTMSSIWALAIYAPDSRLSNLLLEVQSKQEALGLEESPSPAAGDFPSEMTSLSQINNGPHVMSKPDEDPQKMDSSRYAKAHQFVKEILSKSPFSHPPEMTNTRPTDFTVSGLLSFSDEIGRQKICGLMPTDIEALKELGNVLLPKPSGRNSLKEWSTMHHLTLSDSQIERIHRASLLFQNQMVPNDAGKLAMAARIAQGKPEQVQPKQNL